MSNNQADAGSAGTDSSLPPTRGAVAFDETIPDSIFTTAVDETVLDAARVRVQDAEVDARSELTKVMTDKLRYL